MEQNPTPNLPKAADAPSSDAGDVVVQKVPATSGRHVRATSYGRLAMFSLVGLGFGLAQSLVGFLAAGIGHGCYVSIGLSSSPLGFFGDVLVAIVGGPILWALFAGLAATADRRPFRLAFLALIFVHYLALWPIWTDAGHTLETGITLEGQKRQSPRSS